MKRNKSNDEGQSLAQDCPACRKTIRITDLAANFWVCPTPECGYHFLITAHQRLELLVDPDSFIEMDGHLEARDPIGFPGYAEKLEQVVEQTCSKSAALTGVAKIEGVDVVVAMTDFHFFAGAMNSVVGERFARAIDHAREARLPVLLISGSGGGAMMHEGLFSLIQMPIVVGALSYHKQAGLLSICLLTDPTYGGVSASWASQAHITLAEPGARIGFVGGRVTGLKLLQAAPKSYRTAEYQLEHGMIDRIVARSECRQVIGRILRGLPKAENCFCDTPETLVTEIRRDFPKADDAFQHDQSGSDTSVFTHAIDYVRAARHPDRPHSLDLIRLVFDRFVPLKGDRCGHEDGAIVGGLGVLAGLSVVVIAHQKNRTMAEKALRNYGMAGPAGYRKAMRLMRMAEQLGWPVICLIDTPGADDSVDSENQGISYALAESQATMINLQVPSVAVIIGEGGSGGAIALAVADRVLIMQYAYYSVILPAGCAAIVWKDAALEAEAADALRLTANEVCACGIVDAIVEEPVGGAHTDLDLAAKMLQAALIENLGLAIEGKIPGRYDRLRGINNFLEA